MAQLYFKYGAMGSSKSANALMARFNYEERGQETLMVKPRLDSRDGDHMVCSRIGLKHPCIYFDEMLELSEEDRAAFIADVVTAANAIHAVYHPNKLNYGMYGDTGCHLHMHLVPKYKDEFEWGGTFAMDPNMKKITDEAELEKIAAPLREAMLKK